MPFLVRLLSDYTRRPLVRIWSLMQLERQLRPEAYRRRRGGYLDLDGSRPPICDTRNELVKAHACS
jgi:hypothetical protein